MDEDGYVSVADKASEWGLSVRRVRYLCSKYLVFRAFRDKTTGEWKIPNAAERPIDRRQYRYRKVPPHFRDLVQHVDVAVAEIKAHPKYAPEESWRRFVRGSAFHMHTLGKSSLRFCDVCDCIDGKDVPGRDVVDLARVAVHVDALERVRAAAKAKRRLSMTLVREIAKALNGGVRTRCRDWRASHDLAALVQRVAQSNAHPLIKAGDMLEGLFWLHPYPHENEKLGYMLANFILMRAGYPPAIIFRIVFRTVEEYWRRYEERKMPVPPAKFRAFLNACVSRAVRRSAVRLGIGPVIDFCPISLVE